MHALQESTNAEQRGAWRTRKKRGKSPCVCVRVKKNEGVEARWKGRTGETWRQCVCVQQGKRNYAGRTGKMKSKKN